MRGVMSFVRTRWGSVDPRTMGLFRIVFGTLLITDLLRRVPVMVAFYTNDGVLTNHFALFRPAARWVFSLFHAFSTPGEVGVLFALTFCVYFCYLIGWKTRLAQVLSFVLVTSLHSRNILLENGGDVIMNLVAAWTMFLPLGRRFSVDAVLASLRAAEEHTADALNDRTRPPPAPTVPFLSMAVFALLVQFALIYGFNAGRYVGPTWCERSGMSYVV